MAARRSWRDLVADLGSALVEVLRAEASDLGSTLGRSGRELGKALGLLAAAAAVGFWLVAVTTLALVEIGAIWLPRWGATLVVVGLFAVVVAGLALFGWRKLSRLSPPQETVRRHLDDHLDWWRDRVLGSPVRSSEAEAGAGAGGGAGRAPAEDVAGDDEEERG